LVNSIKFAPGPTESAPGSVKSGPVSAKLAEN
jgi:hypothetical protein